MQEPDGVFAKSIKRDCKILSQSSSLPAIVSHSNSVQRIEALL